MLSPPALAVLAVLWALVDAWGPYTIGSPVVAVWYLFGIHQVQRTSKIRG